MWNRFDRPSAERARTLAKTGKFTCLLELRQQLRLEGYAASELRSDKLRKELMDIIERRNRRTFSASQGSPLPNLQASPAN